MANDDERKLNDPRDAWGACRGYGYQASVIVMYWIKLPDGSKIHAELGEDFAQISDSGVERRVQVKHCDKPSIGFSGAVMWVLFEAFQQFKENTSLQFEFLYSCKSTTTKGFNPGVWKDNPDTTLALLRDKSVETKRKEKNRLVQHGMNEKYKKRTKAVGSWGDWWKSVDVRLWNAFVENSIFTMDFAKHASIDKEIAAFLEKMVCVCVCVGVVSCVWKMHGV